MKKIYLVYISLSGNTQSFIRRLTSFLNFHSSFDFDVEEEEELPEGWQDEIKLIYKDEE